MPYSTRNTLILFKIYKTFWFPRILSLLKSKALWYFTLKCNLTNFWQSLKIWNNFEKVGTLILSNISKISLQNCYFIDLIFFLLFTFLQSSK